MFSRDFLCGRWTRLCTFNWSYHNRNLTLKAFVLSNIIIMSLSVPCSSLLRVFKWPVTSTNSARSLLHSSSSNSSVTFSFCHEYFFVLYSFFVIIRVPVDCVDILYISLLGWLCCYAVRVWRLWNFCVVGSATNASTTKLYNTNSKYIEEIQYIIISVTYYRYCIDVQL
jgi:hypothetical protein